MDFPENYYFMWVCIYTSIVSTYIEFSLIVLKQNNKDFQSNNTFIIFGKPPKLVKL